MAKKRKENSRHLKAFKMYADLKLEAEDDVFQKVADAFSVKKKTVYNWSHDFNWAKRYEEIEQEAREKALRKLAKDIEKQDIRVMQKAILKMREVEDNVIGSIDGFYSVKDYEIMLKIYRLLTGKATERIETNNNTNYSLNEEEKKLISNLSDNILKSFNNSENIKANKERENKERIDK